MASASRPCSYSGEPCRCGAALSGARLSVVPLIFLLVTLALLVNTFIAAPKQALEGVTVLLVGLPFYAWWSRPAARRPSR